MNEKRVREKYRKLLNDIDFDKLELGLKKPNIFQILGISRMEIRHSNFLGWLLDPNENHGLSKLFLIKFLRGISTSDIVTDLDEINIDSLNFNNTEIRREWKNIDLLILSEDIVIAIENKIDSKDHSNQLSKYRKIVNDTFPNKKKIFVYLTPTGEAPTSKKEIQHYALYSYQEIIEQIERILNIYGSAVSSEVYIYISDYINTIKRELMKNDELNILADKIYKNHRELLDFIFTNKSDVASELYDVFVDKIEQSGWIVGSKHKGLARFLTPKLHEIIPNKGEGWPLKESFLFELNFFWRKKQVVFKTVIAPGDKDVREILEKAIEKVEGSLVPIGSKHLVHFIYSWKFDKEKLVEDKTALIKNLNTEWDKITTIVNNVETELIKIKDELKNHKE